MKNKLITSIEVETLYTECNINNEGEKVENLKILNKEIAFKYSTSAKELVNKFHQMVADEPYYQELYKTLLASSTINEKLICCQLLMENLANVPVKYNTGYWNKEKREFRLEMTMLSKLATHAKFLSKGREDPISSQYTHEQKSGFLDRIKKVFNG